ncbi:ferric-chelate reductase [Sporormia fimetaria CBS 119925]|uniref:ferric-chelate reductase (NADPH) n=1 Tax=Sporormia fimetaria CBS 119925 TaxID=1340428 RepID=A0A6A6VHN2_9PLEO|nr:ferric-chelate reductase [Sporormia fimetaria CBS 119925]
MSHSGHSAGAGIPDLDEFPKFYWAVVGAAIGVGALVNLYNYVLHWQRLSALRAGDSRPAKPKSMFFVGIATLYALVREASNFSFQLPAIRDRVVRLPTFGRLSLISANLVVLLVLGFYGFDLGDRWSRETIGHRWGHVTIAQLPLIFLLAGKNNLIGYLVGISHERLNWIHRWCARCMLLTATLHMGYFFADWAPYDYIGTQIEINPIVWKGLAAWVVLAWIVFSSMSPIRGWCYEFFVVQHLVSFALLIAFIYIHTPAENHVYIWIPVGFFFFDRASRGLRLLYANLSLFHSKQNPGQDSGLWACKAEFIPLAHDTTRVVINNPPIKWAPGQHVFLSCHSVVPLQSHPFTVASIPADGKMEFLIKSESGGTKRFFRHAQKVQGLPQGSPKAALRAVTVEGPYGCIRPLRQFDSIILLAGSTGATFTVPLLRDILQAWKEGAEAGKHISAVTRHARFVWAVKSRGQLEFFAEQLSAVCSEFDALQERLRDIKLEISIYVTCDETFTDEHKQTKNYTVEYRSTSPSLYNNNENKSPESQTQTRAVPPRDAPNACGPDGTCCCRTTVDEDSPDAITQCTCCCNANSSQSNNNRPASRISSTPSSSNSTRPKPFLHPSILVFSGRPSPRNIIRKSLEQAFGESAVVVCGPKGLVHDVKHDVCVLSDERAVHKGTGAQGIYLHTESFGY